MIDKMIVVYADCFAPRLRVVPVGGSGQGNLGGCASSWQNSSKRKAKDLHPTRNIDALIQVKRVVASNGPCGCFVEDSE
jgi:hypothetical protein